MFPFLVVHRETADLLANFIQAYMEVDCRVAGNAEAWPQVMMFSPDSKQEWFKWMQIQGQALMFDVATPDYALRYQETNFPVYANFEHAWPALGRCKCLLSPGFCGSPLRSFSQETNACKPPP